jgi:hypothetical protein
MDALEAYFVDSSTWNELELGPPPTEVDNRIPQAVKVRMNDRLRKRDERRRDRDAAIAKQAEADQQLRTRLVQGTFGNFMQGPGLDDLSPVKSMIADGVPMEHILIGLKRRCDRRIDPHAAPLASWRDERFLTEVARAALLGGLMPKLVAGWAAAGMAPARAADASEASQAIQEPPTTSQNAPAVPPANGRAHPGGDAAELGSQAAALLQKFGRPDAQAALAHAGEGHASAPQPVDRKPVAPGREAILAAFARNRTAPPPATPQPRPARQVDPEPLSDEATDELIQGWKAGNLPWPRRLLGGEPGHADCRLSPAALRRNRL